MTKRWGVLLLVVVVVAVVAFLVLNKRGNEASSQRHAQRAGSAQLATAAPTTDAKQAARAQITVTGASGPIANATVRLSHEGEVTLVQTGTDGVARTDSLEAGTWSISASAEGHEPAAATTRELRGGETAKIDIVLAAGGRTLSGVVTDASGGPIAGARVDAAKLGGLARASDAVASTTTGADGKYKLQTSEGQLLVAASEPELRAAVALVDVGAAGATADFALVPGGVIEGVVRDERTRDPVAGAQVHAQPRHAGNDVRRARATSRDHGRRRPVSHHRPCAPARTTSTPARRSARRTRRPSSASASPSR